MKINNEKQLNAFRGRITMETPNSLIDHFSGVLEGTNEIGNTRLPIFPNNIILRGCVLRSTEWMIGLVVNTGHDVKIMQSKIEIKVKTSTLEVDATKQLIGVIGLLLFLCLAIACAQAGFNSYWNIQDIWYLDWQLTVGQIFIIKFFYTLLLHASFVPVALYVSMALVRYGQSYFMTSDRQMYYREKDIPMIVKSMNLNEELGQITHIFSDKTGTLTSNTMNFRKASINGISYGKGITEIGKSAWKLQNKPIPSEMLEAEELASKGSIPHVAFYCPDFDRDFYQYGRLLQASSSSSSSHSSNPLSLSPRPNTTSRSLKSTASPSDIEGVSVGKVSATSSLQYEKIKDFYRFLSICHEVIPERLDNGEIKLSASNPDDEALVCAASYFGYEFKDRRDKFAVVFDKERQQNIEIEILYTIPFTSSRKRMSVIIRDIDSRIKIITKGADTMILSRCDPNSVDGLNAITSEHINQYSIEGLRCLMLATATIEDENFLGWSKHYDEANTDLIELEKKKNGKSNDIETLEDLIERGLKVIGATAIEDRLQDGVSECIETLTQCGLKVWVLTGDKEETAINIAIACNLLLPEEYMDHIIVNEKTAADSKKAAYMLKKEIAVRRLDFFLFLSFYISYLCFLVFSFVFLACLRWIAVCCMMFVSFLSF
jgi:phospholipid-transporting ATPase